MDKKTILIFGVGELQRSIIHQAQKMGLYTIGIDPCADAACKDEVDAFEIVGGMDFEGTCAVVEKYNISSIVTSATDKPLVMMARIAERYGFPFFSVDTAQWSTDKFQMKQRFQLGGIPCAKGLLIRTAEEAKDLIFPIICKPRDNSGSRGVKLCINKAELQECIEEALQYSRLDTVLVEEYIEGKEYSVEALHFDGITEVIQFTEKKTTEHPYNVEIGHQQPANLTGDQRNAIRDIIAKIGKTMKFENCPSHTELKINDRGIFVIETSPRLGGDYITSTLVPLSTGINMEGQLLHIALGEKVDINTGRVEKSSGICFFCFPEGLVKSIDKEVNMVKKMPGVCHFKLNLKEGGYVNKITSSLNRYGEVVVWGADRRMLEERCANCLSKITESITIIS